MLPTGSDLTLKKKGKHNSNLSHALVVEKVGEGDEVTKQYLVGQTDFLWGSGELADQYRKDLQLESYVMDLPYEVQAPVYFRKSDGKVTSGFVFRSSADSKLKLTIPSIGGIADLDELPTGNIYVPNNSDIIKQGLLQGRKQQFNK